MLLDILQQSPSLQAADNVRSRWSFLCVKHLRPADGLKIFQMSTWTPAQQLCLSYLLMVLQLSVSSALILVNKWILSVLKFNFPIILSSSGMLFSALATYVLIDVLQIMRIPDETRKAVSGHFQLTRMWPVALANAITLATGNYAYLYLSVSIIQVLKSLTPVITLALLTTLRMMTPTFPLVASVLIISAGCALAAWGEVKTAGESTVFGMAIFVCSEVSECVRVVLIQHILEGRSDVQLNAISTLYYMAGPTFICCQLLAIPLEYRRFMENPHGDLAKQPVTLLAASSLGFLVNILAFLVIQTARGGSLTFKSAQMLKNAVLVIISSYLFGNIIANSVAIGYGISIVGFGWYSVLSAQSQASVHRSPEASK